MTKGKALFIAFLTVWPFIYAILFFVLMAVLVISSAGRNPPGDLPLPFIIVFLIHGATMLLTMGMTAYYIYHVFTTERVHKDQKALWAVVLFLGNIFAMPIYWYLYIWKPLQTNPSE